MRIIVPCAGYGTRMGMAPNKSKELLPDEDGLPMIEWCLSLFNKGDYLLVIREGKQDLIDYCIKNQYLFITVPETKEWPATVLLSKPYWNEDNLLLLPDTRFAPVTKAYLVPHVLCHFAVAVGTHTVDNISKWGAVENKTLCEKPDDIRSGKAWGFIGFKESIGEELFTNFLIKNQWSYYHKLEELPLKWFKDITRGR